ncbi:MAG: hypothetical protein RIB55_13495 [Nitratireductor sp.]
MTLSSLRIAAYDIALTDQPATLPGGRHYLLYRPQQTSALSIAGEAPLGADQARLFSHSISVSGEGLAWLFEVAPVGAELIAGAQTEIVCAHPLPDVFSGPAILRADQVFFPLGSRTPKHGHRGPGLRRLIEGKLCAQAGGVVERILPGQAWFEDGPTMVIGTNISAGRGAFVRLLVLPCELEGGQTSFVPADSHEAQRPRGVDYRLFGECPIAS